MIIGVIFPDFSNPVLFQQHAPWGREEWLLDESNKSVHFDALSELRLRTEIMSHELALENVAVQRQGRGKIAAQGR